MPSFKEIANLSGEMDCVTASYAGVAGSNPLKRSRNLCLFHSFIIPPISIFCELVEQILSNPKFKEIFSPTFSPRIMNGFSSNPNLYTCTYSEILKLGEGFHGLNIR